MNLLLAGSGNLGSRYIQGLVSLEKPISLTVVDPSQASIDIAKIRLDEVDFTSNHSIKFSTSLSEIADDFDLAFIVTPAHCRADLVKRLCESKKINAWVLEKVLAQSSEQLDLIYSLLGTNNRSWVNTPRRLMDWHKQIRAALLSDSKSLLQVSVSGGSWDLACNAIHFIDLVSWWTGAAVSSVTVKDVGHWVQSKRPSFFEFIGELVVKYNDGSILELNCDHGQDPLVLTVTTCHGEWVINESLGTAFGPNGEVLRGELTYQSSLTAPLVIDILEKNRCSLPPLIDSILQHEPFIDALLQHWNSVHSLHLDSLPIT